MRIKYIIFLLIFFCITIIIVNAQTDTINCVFAGYFGNSKFRVYYKNKKVKDINFRLHKAQRFNTYSVPKHSKNVNFEFVIDELQENQPVKFEIYLKRNFLSRYRNTDCSISFLCRKKYLVIYPDYRLKRRYYISYYWSDEYPLFE